MQQSEEHRWTNTGKALVLPAAYKYLKAMQTNTVIAWCSAYSFLYIKRLISVISTIDVFKTKIISASGKNDWKKDKSALTKEMKRRSEAKKSAMTIQVGVDQLGPNVSVFPT